MKCWNEKQHFFYWIYNEIPGGGNIPAGFTGLEGFAGFAGTIALSFFSCGLAKTSWLFASPAGGAGKASIVGLGGGFGVSTVSTFSGFSGGAGFEALAGPIYYNKEMQYYDLQLEYHYGIEY